MFTNSNTIDAFEVFITGEIVFFVTHITNVIRGSSWVFRLVVHPSPLAMWLHFKRSSTHCPNTRQDIVASASQYLHSLTWLPFIPVSRPTGHRNAAISAANCTHTFHTVCTVLFIPLPVALLSSLPNTISNRESLFTRLIACWCKLQISRPLLSRSLSLFISINGEFFACANLYIPFSLQLQCTQSAFILYAVAGRVPFYTTHSHNDSLSKGTSKYERPFVWTFIFVQLELSIWVYKLYYKL